MYQLSPNLLPKLLEKILILASKKVSFFCTTCVDIVSECRGKPPDNRKTTGTPQWFLLQDLAPKLFTPAVQREACATHVDILSGDIPLNYKQPCFIFVIYNCKLSWVTVEYLFVLFLDIFSSFLTLRFGFWVSDALLS